MKKVLSIAVLLAAAICCDAAVPPVPTTPVQIAHEASFHIGQKTTLDGVGCTATAIGPHALLTDTHCELGSDDLYIANNVGEGFVPIAGHIRDKNDHTIYLVNNGVPFRVFAQVALDDPLVQGEDVFVWGNPGDWSDQFRKGYITGYLQDEESDLEEILFDLRAWHGDSGAGIFNLAGQLVSTISQGEGQGAGNHTIQLTSGFALGFSKAEIARAAAYAPPVVVHPPDEPTTTGVPGKK